MQWKIDGKPPAVLCRWRFLFGKFRFMGEIDHLLQGGGLPPPCKGGYKLKFDGYKTAVWKDL
jgi:hypothetical protein